MNDWRTDDERMVSLPLLSIVLIFCLPRLTICFRL
jgi:hypothetical protein